MVRRTTVKGGGAAAAELDAVTRELEAVTPAGNEVGDSVGNRKATGGAVVLVVIRKGGFEEMGWEGSALDRGETASEGTAVVESPMRA